MRNLAYNLAGNRRIMDIWNGWFHPPSVEAEVQKGLMICTQSEKCTHSIPGLQNSWVRGWQYWKEEKDKPTVVAGDFTAPLPEAGRVSKPTEHVQRDQRHWPDWHLQNTAHVTDRMHTLLRRTGNFYQERQGCGPQNKFLNFESIKIMQNYKPI